MKQFLSTVAFVSGVAALSAGVAQAQVALTAETTTPGGTPYVTITALAELAGAAGIADIQVLEGQTATNIVQNIAEGRTAIGVAPLQLPFLMAHSVGPYSSLGERGEELASQLRALYPYNVGSYAMLSPEASGIRAWSDIAGRRVFDGPPRGQALSTARALIQLATGLTEEGGFTGVQANWGELPTVLTDGSVDASIVPTGFPSVRVTTALSAGAVNVVSFPKDIFEGEGFAALLRQPGNTRIVLSQDELDLPPGAVLISEDGMYRALGAGFAEVVNASMSFELAHDLTALHIANLDNLRARAPFMRNSSLGELGVEESGFCGVNPLRYHPGAIAAWEEAGYVVPDCAR
ncbi:MAG: C4-dicarboxylate ABC transporter substrate-binding protein [Rhodobacter sp.]|nr:C4-dicarboxylate ABC transporter substrate-binding protein [Paracoccaceae bacterium]MCC0075738.1 C4-dicarboxylate ABC transporter substrate-binding protein [Rhodobacter sp.]